VKKETNQRPAIKVTPQQKAECGTTTEEDNTDRLGYIFVKVNTTSWRSQGKEEAVLRGNQVTDGLLKGCRPPCESNTRKRTRLDRNRTAKAVNPKYLWSVTGGVKKTTRATKMPNSPSGEEHGGTNPGRATYDRRKNESKQKSQSANKV